MKVYTNNHHRQLKYRHEVPEKILADYFDWLTEDMGGTDGFFCYRSRWYHVSEFMRFDQHAPFDKKWDGYISDSFFSGILIKLPEDCETYQVATYIG